jgi:hypothetical protein
MKQITLLTAVMALASLTVYAADTGSKDVVTNAAKALGTKTSYSWKSTVVVPEGTPFRMGPTEGQTEKDGFTSIKMTFGDNSAQAIMKGDKAAFTGQDGTWQSLAELTNSEGPGRFMGMMFRNYKAPVAQAQELAAAAQDLKKDGDVYSGDLTEAGAKALLTFRRGTEGPAVTNAKGSVKFWVKDGVLDKYEFKVKGTMSFNGEDRDIDRDTTVEIKNVGTTKVTIPDDAKKKLE